MVTYATLTVPVLDIIGANFNESRASVWIEPNVPAVIADSIRVGGRREQVVNGVATFTNLVTTNSADNPANFGYRVKITAPPKGAQKREDIVVLTTSDFPFTATANLKDIDEAWDDIALPAVWRSEFLTSVSASASAAAASATSAAASAALAQDIALGDAEATLASAVVNPGPVRDNLTATYAGVRAGVGGGKVIKDLRRPMLLIDQEFPTEQVDHAILWWDGASTLYGKGQDGKLRKSTDGGGFWAPRAYDATNKHAAYGVFFKTTAGAIISQTTTGASEYSLPCSLMRSTPASDGNAFTNVLTFGTNKRLLGPQSIAQDLVTGYLYCGEYHVDATVTQVNVWRSTDDGATWTAFHTFNGPGTASADRVRHVHSVQWDPVDQRIYVLTGDGEAKAGTYRVNAGGTALEPVITNDEAGGASNRATAVGLMFFPTHIAWLMDTNAGETRLMRMARSQIGQTNPTVEATDLIMTSTGWFTVRAAADNTQWVACVSNESPGNLDNGLHLFLISNNGADYDEIGAMGTDGTTLATLAPVGQPLQGPAFMLRAHNLAAPPAPGLSSAFAFRARIGYGVEAIRRPRRRPPFYNPSTRNGQAVLAASGVHVFGHTRSSAAARTLYIKNYGARVQSGTGTVKVSVYNTATSTEITSTTVSDYINQSNEETGNYISAYTVTAGHNLEFRLTETGGANAATCTGFVDFAWGP